MRGPGDRIVVSSLLWSYTSTHAITKHRNKCMQTSLILSSYCIIASLVAMKPLILKGLHGTFLGNFVSKEKANR